jgi:hypothetical protein
MTKEEYLKRLWHYEDCAIRTVDSDGTLTYRHSQPEIQGGYWESFNKYKTHLFTRQDVADWWQDSLQTKEQYLQLQKSINQ